MDRIELEECTGIRPVADTRRRMDEPPPVRLVAVADVTLSTTTAAVSALDGFYVKLLGFVREPAGNIYRSETFRLRFETAGDPYERNDLRPQRVELPSLATVERDLIRSEIDYERQRNLTTGQLSLLLRDPAGNWIELLEYRLVG